MRSDRGGAEAAVHVVGPNRLLLLRDGAEAFPAMLDAIDSAQASICLETYILRDDATGRRFVDRLCDQAGAGVEVNLLHDALGSSITASLDGQLQRAGVRRVAFHRLSLAALLGLRPGRPWRRDHRKILTVDGRVGFLGGINLADDYAPIESGGGGWRDTHLRLEGPVVRDLEALFLLNWRRSGGPATDRGARGGGRDDPRVRIVGSGLGPGTRAVRREYLRAIRSAASRVMITNGYFLPPLRTLLALLGAARRGAEVRIIVAGTTDVPPVIHAARALYGQLLRAGVRLFEWRGSVLHAKTAVIDGRWATVGSSNLDALSLFVNLEANAVVEDEAFAAELERMFEADLPGCDEVTVGRLRQRPILERLVSWFWFLFRRWL